MLSNDSGGATGANAYGGSSSGDILRDGGNIFYTKPWGSRTSSNGRTLLSYEGPGGEVKVPDGMVCIGEEAFAFCTHVTDVILPEGVWLIERKAFYRSGIRNISLPESMKRIEELAFAHTPLIGIDIPDQTQNVGNRAFFEAAHLERAKLPEGMISLEPETFSGCVSLKEVVFPAGLKYIQGRAFENCISLERIRLPEKLVAAWRRAFYGCRSLVEVYFGDSAEAIGYDAFSGCTALSKMRIPAGLKMTNGDAFENAGRVELTGPGAAQGLVIEEEPTVYYIPGQEKAVIPEGVETFPEYYQLWSGTRIKVLELSTSLKTFSWFYLAQIGDLRQIISDRGTFGPEIAHLLDVECVDKNGRKLTFRAPIRFGKWIVEPDEANNGLRITGRRGQMGEAGTKGYITLIIPARIKGKAVTSIGKGVFADYDTIGAVYIPDSVKRIESGAFARCGYDMIGGRTLFVRMPDHVRFTSGAFEGTKYITRQTARETRQRLYPKPKEETAKTPAGAFSGGATTTATGAQFSVNRFVAAAVDDPAIGTGTDGRPCLRPNIWQYLDRLSREERIRALTHSFTVEGRIDGYGWASIKIELDGDKTRFRISYIGKSPAAFRTFAKEIEDGENEGFMWASEPGAYPWRIQRRGGIFYVNAPEIKEGFFISRVEFLLAIKDLKAEW
ncbi:MAG: leucine-rich repeat protein [Lachnospiraceae bacterium]|nr:leucine-rich repeat protein [Lachnospiraceae bacterium]